MKIEISSIIINLNELRGTKNRDFSIYTDNVCIGLLRSNLLNLFDKEVIIMKYYALNEKNYGRKVDRNHRIMIPKKLRTDPNSVIKFRKKRTGFISDKFDCYAIRFIRQQDELCRKLHISRKDSSNSKCGIVFLEDNKRDQLLIPFRIYSKGFEVEPRFLNKFENAYSEEEQAFIYSIMWYAVKECNLRNYIQYLEDNDLTEYVSQNMQENILTYNKNKVPQDIIPGEQACVLKENKLQFRGEFEDGTLIECTIFTKRALNYDLNAMFNSLLK